MTAAERTLRVLFTCPACKLPMIGWQYGDERPRVPEHFVQRPVAHSHTVGTRYRTIRTWCPMVGEPIPTELMS